ncbi:RNA methylase [Lactobacillus selangorensis]|uniref:site-specific DNA-methyltransferase (adenine-specific) n=1 Tax=Lactobacillus selangorensis TaxID=81857 RepID=A0A0R2FM26_9LACO|nr:N-6 DNA methylase [Lactobacillus selangorensis]KRN29262.1 RNA methylase [Lactobacillus selangorensis]KRN29780.1 RNA methylase [Lactobacillus selangorensis]
MTAKRIISKATQQNWKRLGKNGHQLTKRANKTESTLKNIPKKYLRQAESAERITALLDWGQQHEPDFDTFILKLALHAVLAAQQITPEHQARFKQAVGVNDTLPAEALFDFMPEEPDLLGALYQTGRTEGTRNKNGLYYTPAFVTDKVVQRLAPNQTETYLDPACGSGAFLVPLAQAGVPLDHLYGTDTDRIAVLLCIANLLLRVPNAATYPHIYVADFLTGAGLEKLPLQFGHVLGNPPWGAKKFAVNRQKSFLAPKADSFAYFLEFGLQKVVAGGTLTFMLPISFLNVASHADIRRLVLTQTTIEQIVLLDHLFTGVFSDVICLHLKQQMPAEHQIQFRKQTKVIATQQADFLQATHYNLLPQTDFDQQIITKLRYKGHLTLQNSQWGLGIVTGNNKKYVLATATTDSEPLITGKELRPYRLAPLTKAIVYHRDAFQQVAPDTLYRASEKLLYKFISSRLTFSYDDQGRLPLNSANVLIPDVPTHSVKTVLACLNGAPLNYVYQLKFASPKILKGDLQALWLPELDAAERARLEKLVAALLATAPNSLAEKQAQADIDAEWFRFYELTEPEINRIKGVLDKDAFEG